MAYSFFVVMLKSKSGVGYPDMHKVSNDKFYLFEEEAIKAHQELPEDIRNSFGVVELVALSKGEYESTNPDVLTEKIVKECMSICDEVQDQYGKYTFTARVCKERFSEHFGVQS